MRTIEKREARGSALRIRLSGGELAAVEAVASKLRGMSITAVARELMLDAARRFKADPAKLVSRKTT